MTRDEVSTYLAEIFPEPNWDGEHFVIESVRLHGARVKLNYHDQFLRPGGTISGPAAFTLADYGMYAALLANIGKVALAVTTNANINFLRRPAPTALIAEVDLIKLGKRLAVCDVRMMSQGSDDLVAHVTGTYSLPPNAVK